VTYLFIKSCLHISLSSLVIIAASVLRYRAEKPTDTQTNGGKNIPPQLPSALVNTT